MSIFVRTTLLFCWNHGFLLQPYCFVETMDFASTVLFCWNHGFCFKRHSSLCSVCFCATTDHSATSGKQSGDRRRQDAGDGGDKRRPPAWEEEVCWQRGMVEDAIWMGRRFSGVVRRACETEGELCVDQSNEIQPFKAVPSNARQLTGRKFGPVRRRLTLPKNKA